MDNLCLDLEENYYSWLKKQTTFMALDSGYVEVTVPLLDRHNDYMQIYIRKQGDTYLVTDGGYTINDLLDCGINVNTNPRKKTIKQITDGYHTTCSDSQIFASASLEDLPSTMNDVIQSCLSIDNLLGSFQMATGNVFCEDAFIWLDSKDVHYIRNVKFSGKSGYDNMFNLAIPKTKKAPERIVDIISVPRLEKIRNAIWKWEDSKDYRDENTEMYVILNNSETNVPEKSIKSLKNYSITPLLWTERENNVECLCI